MIKNKPLLLPRITALLFSSICLAFAPVQAELVTQAELRLAHETVPLKDNLDLQIDRIGFEIYGERIKGIQLGLSGGWLDSSIDNLPTVATTELSGKYLGLRLNNVPAKAGWAAQWSADYLFYQLDKKIDQREIELDWSQINLNLGYGFAGEDFRIAAGIEALVIDGDLQDNNGLNQGIQQDKPIGGWLEFGLRADQHGDLLIKISAPHQQMIQLSFRNSF
ncbi:hypothetical protein [Pelagibaculum spongiae]|uniref:Outer membrane protein beta-barrel domain-containing protein n=1 Tax=Pelagibaculum spongiae TaxID=2080658 RepID=A0A2V1GW17_9GAMM|nr:hypothetical protein [Pelagibaculum spongiae]PVZ68148.1 hypothetical protein DC094_12650 [Pelagibaculum spongiae]